MIDSTEDRIQTPESYSGVRGLRHGPGPEAPQPLAHGPSGLHPALGLGTSTSPRRSPPPRCPVPGVPATLALRARPARYPPRLGPKGAGPRRHTDEACVAVGAEKGPRAPALVPAPQDSQDARPSAAGQKLGPRRQSGRAPRLTQQGAGQGAAAIAPRSSGPPSVSAAPIPRPLWRRLHPRLSPSASELPTTEETRT